MKNNQENQVIAPAVTEAVEKTILELTELIQSMTNQAAVHEVDKLSTIVTATSELCKAFKL
ncbi:hypothetical protein P4283_22735 [Bacillus thuringiensis]|nr:hypothetical protein [Bacillus thuringiensis]